MQRIFKENKRVKISALREITTQVIKSHDLALSTSTVQRRLNGTSLFELVYHETLATKKRKRLQ